MRRLAMQTHLPVLDTIVLAPALHHFQSSGPQGCSTCRRPWQGVFWTKPQTQLQERGELLAKQLPEGLAALH